MQANFRHNLEGKLYNTHPYFYGATEWSQASYDFISSSLIMRHGRDRDGSRWRPTNSVTALKEFPRESANIWPHNIMAEKNIKNTENRLHFFSGVPHDGVLPWWRYVAKACGHWPYSRLSGSRCWLTVHQYQSPLVSWYEGIHKVSSNDWVVIVTPQWPDGNFIEGLHALHTQRNGAFSLE